MLSAFRREQFKFKIMTPATEMHEGPAYRTREAPNAGKREALPALFTTFEKAYITPL